MSPNCLLTVLIHRRAASGLKGFRLEPYCDGVGLSGRIFRSFMVLDTATRSGSKRMNRVQEFLLVTLLEDPPPWMTRTGRCGQSRLPVTGNHIQDPYGCHIEESWACQPLCTDPLVDRPCLHHLGSIRTDPLVCREFPISCIGDGQARIGHRKCDTFFRKFFLSCAFILCGIVVAPTGIKNFRHESLYCLFNVKILTL